MNDRLIYIADMDVNVRQFLKENLESSCYSLKTFDNGERLVWECSKSVPDLLIYRCQPSRNRRIGGLPQIEAGARHKRYSHPVFNR